MWHKWGSWLKNMTIYHYPAIIVVDLHAALACWRHQDTVELTTGGKMAFTEEGRLDPSQGDQSGSRPTANGTCADESDSLARLSKEL